MRKLATLEEIIEIKEHSNADAIELAIVRGWQSVVKKAEFKAGDQIIYCEIDSWIPHKIAPFLTRGNDTPKEFEGIKGQRLKTARFRGEISQGLILSASLLPEDHSFQKGDDVAEVLGIIKWEPPIPACLGGQVVGGFPTHLVRKTDQERVQNIFDKIDQAASWEISIKLDGSSVTILRYEGELRVCSRNWELQMNEDNAQNTLVQMAHAVGEKILDGYAFQGELMGEGIQKNREKIRGHKWFVFDVYNIGEKRYLSSQERLDLCQEYGLDHVPILEYSGSTPSSVQEALEKAEGESWRAKIREGIVFKNLEDPRHSFKAISNKFLLKYN